MTAFRYRPENQLKAKLGASSPGDDLRAIEALKSRLHLMVPELMNMVASWLSEMHLCLQQHDPHTVSRVYALAHKVRGMAGSAGQTHLSDMANSLCVYLDALPANAAPDPRLIQAHVNALSVLQRDGLDEPDSVQAMIGALEFAARKHVRRVNCE